jgi:hypothetical protein
LSEQRPSSNCDKKQCLFGQKVPLQMEKRENYFPNQYHPVEDSFA